LASECASQDGAAHFFGQPQRLPSLESRRCVSCRCRRPYGQHFLNNAFLSIVSDKDNRDNLIVRARHHGDIQLVFPKAKVVITPEADYRYRAHVARTLVAEKIASQIAGIDYTNFKASVTDASWNMAYFQVWRTMFIWQGVMVEKLPSTPPPAVTAKAAKKPRRKRWRLFGGRAE
jgi:hypothetical protein